MRRSLGPIPAPPPHPPSNASRTLRRCRSPTEPRPHHPGRGKRRRDCSNEAPLCIVRRCRSSSATSPLISHLARAHACGDEHVLAETTFRLAAPNCGGVLEL
ncbi:hypothetical protein NL676_017303 [Syzygium grande]|nr:hypothetical protein NL676_017303 [Syzygium grande]